MLMKMKKKNLTLMTLLIAGTIGISAPAFAISSVDECNAQVKSAIKELLKAKVSAEELDQIDAELVAAEGQCNAEKFSEAEATLKKASDMMKSAGAS